MKCFHVFGQCVKTVLFAEDVVEARMHFFHDGAAAVEGRLLRQVADAEALGADHLTDIRLDLAQDKVQKRRLAAAVWADQAYLLARKERLV